MFCLAWHSELENLFLHLHIFPPNTRNIQYTCAQRKLITTCYPTPINIYFFSFLRSVVWFLLCIPFYAVYFISFGIDWSALTHEAQFCVEFLGSLVGRRDSATNARNLIKNH